MVLVPPRLLGGREGSVARPLRPRRGSTRPHLPPRRPVAAAAAGAEFGNGGGAEDPRARPVGAAAAGDRIVQSKRVEVEVCVLVQVVGLVDLGILVEIGPGEDPGRNDAEVRTHVEAAEQLLQRPCGRVLRGCERGVPPGAADGDGRLMAWRVQGHQESSEGRAADTTRSVRPREVKKSCNFDAE